MSSMMDAYLKLSTVVGESSTQGFEEQIQIINFRHEMRQTASMSHSSQGNNLTGRVDIGRISFEKTVDISSPNLAKACAEGRHMEEALFSFTRAGSRQNVYYTIKLRNVVISRLSQNARSYGDDELVTEEVELFFDKIEWEYFQTSPAGGHILGSMATGWDARHNTAI